MRVEIEPELIERAERAVRLSEGIAPVSIESIVNMAVEAFLDGLEGR